MISDSVAKSEVDSQCKYYWRQFTTTSTLRSGPVYHRSLSFEEQKVQLFQKLIPSNDLCEVEGHCDLHTVGEKFPSIKRLAKKQGRK